MALAGRVLLRSDEDGVGCWAASLPGGDGAVGRDGDLPRAVGQAAGAPGVARVFGVMFLAAIQSGALGRIYGETCQPRLQLLLCRLVFGLFSPPASPLAQQV